MPRESRDVPDDLPKQALCQVSLGQLENDVLGRPDEAPTGRERPHQTGSASPAGMEVSTSSFIESKGARH